MTDLPLDVRDEASQAAREAMYIQTGTRITQNMAEALVDAVVAPRWSGTRTHCCMPTVRSGSRSTPYSMP